MKISKALILTSLICTASLADQIKIAGSSTVFPFSSYVAEEFSVVKNKRAPIVESIGTGGGFKAFCSANGKNGIDISNASRPMKMSEFEECLKNGIDDISGYMIGYDGIVFAQNKDNGSLNLTKEQIFLALAKEIPQDGKLVANPYKKWSDIDKNLPDKEISVYGPPTTSGTRDSFEEQLMQKASKKFKEYGDKSGKYSQIRDDGIYIPSGENDNLIIAKLVQNKNAFGIFGYGFLAENKDKIVAVAIDNVSPNENSVGDGSYELARSLYFYVKNGNKSSNPDINEFIDLFISESMIGSQGVLKSIGLIPLSKELFEKMQANVKNPMKLTEDMVKNSEILK
ncbi:substrate-binding domain-containing protein [Campylobacter sp.]|uniref:substrate-binding domain-containing protein n=1 Tax=Campylobacter sp. TaxID=205 RepID=UPI0026FE29D8|nr:substrate-binding domain-containing protein [Campylobacter sp.]